MICIDSHQHFWKYNPVQYDWIDESMHLIQQDFFPEDLKPILRSNHVDGCIAVQADSTEQETDFLLQLAHNYKFIKGVVGWVDLLDPNVQSRLAHFASKKELVGIRHIVQGEADDFMMRHDFQNGIKALHQFELTYDILIFPSQLKAAIDLVSKFPDQKFVLDHIAKPGIKAKKKGNWTEFIQILANFENVYCKVSGMVTEANWKGWQKTDFTPYLDVVFESFGVDRIMFGSDWPVCLVAASYADVQSILHDYIKDYTPQDKEKIWGTNAIQFYNLEYT